MFFNSIEFLIFLPIVILLFSLLKEYRKDVLLIASYFFYGWWNWHYLALILLSTIIDYSVAIKLDNTHKTAPYRTLFLAISIISNIGILLFFKYYNFFSSEVNLLLEQLNMSYLLPYSHFILPMGISFYTFQTMSYTIDVFNGKINAEKDFRTFALYVTFFPQLVAGPIERAGRLIGQLKQFNKVTYSNLESGFGRILFGLFKKVVIADRLSIFVNQVYGEPTSFDGFILILATFFFAFQIYCDFSGYSDIAIGIAKIIGIDLMENFKNPYLSKNIQEFWSKWHISLSTWFKDYLYIPLGGNKNSFYRNIIIVFLVSGLWHGANWTFIIWGALHGTFLIISSFIRKELSFLKNNNFNVLGICFTFSFTCIAWVFFRADSIEDALFIIKNLKNINSNYIADFLYQIKTALLNPSKLAYALNVDYGKIYFQFSTGDLLLSLILIPLLVFSEYIIQNRRKNYSNTLKHIMFFVLIVSIMFLGVFSKIQFIYFQF